MKIAVRANESMKAELLSQGFSNSAEITWLEEWKQAPGQDVFIDLLFETSDKLETGAPLLIVNAVNTLSSDLPANAIRINGWPTFLQRSIVEASGKNGSLREKTEEVFKCFNKKIEWVPDKPGFISARVISMIINEAYFALQEKVSTKEEIDIAMKLGTNYPYGPFEWSKLIGLSSIHQLLNVLAKQSPRYAACPLMSQEISKK